MNAQTSLLYAVHNVVLLGARGVWSGELAIAISKLAVAHDAATDPELQPQALHPSGLTEPVAFEWRIPGGLSGWAQCSREWYEKVKEGEFEGAQARALCVAAPAAAPLHSPRVREAVEPTATEKPQGPADDINETLTRHRAALKQKERQEFVDRAAIAISSGLAALTPNYHGTTKHFADRAYSLAEALADRRTEGTVIKP